MNRERKRIPKKHKSSITEFIKKQQDPLAAARSKKRLIIASKIAEAIDNKGIKKIDIAKKLDKYSSEITKWTSGDHNFTMDILSDLEEILGIQLLSTQISTKPKLLHVLQCNLTVEINDTKSKISKPIMADIKNYIAEAGGMQATEIKMLSTILE